MRYGNLLDMQGVGARRFKEGDKLLSDQRPAMDSLAFDLVALAGYAAFEGVGGSDGEQAGNGGP